MTYAGYHSKDCAIIKDSYPTCTDRCHEKQEQIKLEGQAPSQPSWQDEAWQFRHSIPLQAVLATLRQIASDLIVTADELARIAADGLPVASREGAKEPDDGEPVSRGGWCAPTESVMPWMVD